MSRILLAALIILGLVGTLLLMGPLKPSNDSATNSSEQSATIVMNAFYWGWVPELQEPSEGVRVVVAPGAQGSQIIAPQGTTVKLILRNAAALPDLHHALEARFEEYFVEKYGEAWRNVHEASHDADDGHGDEHSEESDSSDQMKSIMTHSFYLEGYDVEVTLSHEKGNHERIVNLTLDKAGEFRFVCMNYCGIGHGDMQGTLVVTTDS